MTTVCSPIRGAIGGACCWKLCTDGPWMEFASCSSTARNATWPDGETGCRWHRWTLLNTIPRYSVCCKIQNHRSICERQNPICLATHQKRRASTGKVKFAMLPASFSKLANLKTRVRLTESQSKKLSFTERDSQ